jgi:hypothetical protein
VPQRHSCGIATIRLPASVLGARRRDRPSCLGELAGNPDQPSVQTDVDPRKSGMPESVEIPAPVGTATAATPRAHAET